MPKKQSTTLYCTEGNSDKVYHVALEPWQSLWTVNFTYGRRGGTMVTGTKTETAISFNPAKEIYDNLIQEKIKKGYEIGEAMAVEKPIKKLPGGKSFNLFYHIENQGDGSAAVYFHKTEKEAQKADEKQSEPFAEDSTSSVKLKIVDNKLYYEDMDDNCNTIWIPVECEK